MPVVSDSGQNSDEGIELGGEVVRCDVVASRLFDVEGDVGVHGAAVEGWPERGGRGARDGVEAGPVRPERAACVRRVRPLQRTNHEDTWKQHNYSFFINRQRPVTHC